MKNNPQAARLSAHAQAQIGIEQNSPKKAVMASTSLIAQQISGLSMARQWTIAHLLHQANDLVNNTLGRVGETAGLQEDYEEYFKSKLAEFNVSSPAELEEEQKADFFNAVSDGWKNGVGPKETAASKGGSGGGNLKEKVEKNKVRASELRGEIKKTKDPARKAKLKRDLENVESAILQFQSALDKGKEESSVETADSYVKATQGVNTYRLKASSSGAIAEALVWKGGEWVKPGAGEEFKEKEDHRMWGALKTANGCALATLTVNEGDDPQAVLAELRHLYGTGTEWNDNSVYDGQVPNVGVTPYSSMAYTQARNPLSRLEAEDRLRVNGVDCDVKGYQDDCLVVVPAGGDQAIALPLDRLVVTSGNEATLLKSQFTSDVVLSSAGFDNLRDYSCLREDVTAAVAGHSALASIGATLGGMVKSGNRRGLQLAMAGLKRLNEGYELIQAGVNCNAETGEVATAAVLTEEAEVEQEQAATGKHNKGAGKRAPRDNSGVVSPKGEGKRGSPAEIRQRYAEEDEQEEQDRAERARKAGKSGKSGAFRHDDEDDRRPVKSGKGGFGKGKRGKR